MTTQESLRTEPIHQRAENRQFERDTLLLHIAVTSPYDAAELSRRIGRPKSAIHEDLTTLMSDGDVHFHEGALRAAAPSRVIAAAQPDQLSDVHNQLLAEIASGIAIRPAALIAMAESGCSDEALLHELLRVVGEHPDDAGAIAALSLVAHTLGYSEEKMRLLSAKNAAAHGQTERVLSIADKLLSSNSKEIHDQAALLAAGALVRSNRLERALLLYQHVGDEHLGLDSAWAVMAAVGQGDFSSAHHWREVLGNDSLTSYSSGLIDFVDGLLSSLTGDGEGSLELLARSISALNPLGADVLLPDTPAGLAAIISISRGEPATAEVLLERALKAELGGRAGRQRHLILKAWSLMVQGSLDASEQVLTRLKSDDELCDRDRLFYWCLIAGIARRRTDLAAMREAWHKLRVHTFGLSLTLFDLLPLGEMMVVAARLHDTQRVRDLVARARVITAGLGEPAAWITPFHWSGVQAAFQANDPGSLIPHANALVAAKQKSTYAATLARAGQTWLEVLRREADFASVEASVRALSEHGQVWDAARLAGQAALQHPEREGALSLMQLAREINKTHAPAHNQSIPRKTTMLTSRELEVAQLVVEGQGYRAIGEQLYISPKTVEHHVARIRNRIGATSRAELLDKLHEIVSEQG